MATQKKFSVAGISTHEGKTKVRFANDPLRIKVLEKNGHKDVELVNLPHEMTKGEIAAYLVEQGFMKGNSAAQEAIAYISKKNPVASTAKATKKAATVTA